jgi:hypothetical protein
MFSDFPIMLCCNNIYPVILFLNPHPAGPASLHKDGEASMVAEIHNMYIKIFKTIKCAVVCSLIIVTWQNIFALPLNNIVGSCTTVIL